MAVSHTETAARSGDGASDALTAGFHAAFWVGTVIAAVGVVASAVLIRREELAAAAEAEQTEAEAAALPLAA